MCPHKDPDKRRATLKKAKRKYREKKKRQKETILSRARAMSPKISDTKRRLIELLGYSAEQLLIRMERDMISIDAEPVYVRIVQFGKIKQFLVSDDPEISVDKYFSDLYDSLVKRGLDGKTSFDDLFWNMTYDPRTYEVKCVKVEEE